MLKEILPTSKSYRNYGFAVSVALLLLVSAFVLPGCGVIGGGIIRSPTNATTTTTALTFQNLMGSCAARDAGVAVVSNLIGQTVSAQMTLSSELNLYNNGASFPVSSGYNYRDIPDVTKDDEGSDGTTCMYAPRPTGNCGIAQTAIADRISNCASVNPLSSSWNGAVQCSGGQGSWKLVTRNGANQEVWQDQRTGLLWSSVIAITNWCQAAGNIQSGTVTFAGSFNTAPGSSITGNGSIGGISGGSSSAAEVIIIIFTSATAFTVSGANCGGGAITAGGLTAVAGSSVTWTRNNFCSFTLTQGSTNFVNNDNLSYKAWMHRPTLVHPEL